MIKTCGLFIFDKNNHILICQPRGNKTNKDWTIPKGKQEKNETELESALRECYEECGLDLLEQKNKCIPIGSSTYSHKKKRLHGFAIHLDVVIDIKNLSCIIHVGKEYPEIINYEMAIPCDAILKLHITQANLLEKYLKKNFS